MTEFSLPWGGTTVGDKGPYTSGSWTAMTAQLLNMHRATEGVIPQDTDSLRVERLDTTHVRVKPGCAIVDGTFYQNTSNVDLTVSVPGSGVYYYTIVLRKSFSAQTVRITAIGPSAVAYPLHTQTDGVTWDLILGRVLVNTTGVATVGEMFNTDFDARRFSRIGNPFQFFLGAESIDSTNLSDSGSYVVPIPYPRVLIGTKVVTINAGSTSGSFLIEWGNRMFDDFPFVMTTLFDGAVALGANASCQVRQVTSTYCSGVVYRTSGDTANTIIVTLQFMAVGMCSSYNP